MIKKRVRLGEIKTLARSTRARDRLRALRVIREQCLERKLEGHWLVAKSLLRDTNTDVRWQAFIVVGEFMESKPQEVCNIIVTYGASDDEDVRTAVGTVLLEHMIAGRHYGMCMTALKEALRREEGDLLRSTIRQCENFTSQSGWKRLQSLANG